ncbi:hypothetical protein [Variovorax sp. PCZ-1]|uniref:hypothetical protein n=1 Tax=Variovorax sp. PCZ-1 TaxID=2835533 RepID=UPI001BCA8078|nr:hypothetical protein [Variovorax sp. PCZ-1]MBS7807327.1 hypothetical protein [Variovorax sp. PCZ-1]
MILRWIQADNRSKKLPSIRRRNTPKLDEQEVGESEFNAILEEVCDTVMPRKPAKKLPLHHDTNHPHKNVANSHSQDIPWSTLFLKLGEETSASLTQALTGLQEIALLHPNVAPAIANVTDQLDHARRAAMIAQQFTQLRGSRELQASEDIMLRQAISDAITQRARWLHRRKVKARLGLLDAQIRANPVSLRSLIDELINWAGGMAKDIGFAVREPTPEQPGTQLIVIARVQTASLEPSEWQNVGWYLWHQLAASLGARAELQVTQEALSVTVDFAAPPPHSSLLHTQGVTESTLDTDISTVISGCRVLLLLGCSEVHEQAHLAVSRMGLRVSACASVMQARMLLGLNADSPPHPLPHAIVFDASAPLPEMTALREQLAQRYPERKMAFVELSDNVGSDFHVSQMGEASTAHVSLKAIPRSLAPALVFELCKVI